MSSPIHRNVLSRLSLLVSSVVLTCSSLTVRADLDVEWIDSNTIRVTGTGYGPPSVVTNWLGCCTNCTMITPQELTLGMDDIISKCGDIAYSASEIRDLADLGLFNAQEQLDEIGTFRRFSNSPTQNPPNSFLVQLTNYIATVDNKQTQLCKEHFPSSFTTSATRYLTSYNNGIYDYANDYVVRYINDYVKLSYSSIREKAVAASDEATTISNIASKYRNLSSCPCGDDDGDGSGGGCAWTQEQIDSLFDYVDHIDQDQHDRFSQLASISNNVFNVKDRLDSYAKTVSGVLYHDGTIQLDDGESWTNVYFSGESENYSYDKSNILQRIELILFGMAHSTTNFSLDASSVTNQLDDIAANNVTNQFNEFSSDSTNSFLNAKEKLEEKVNSIKAISSMFVFWGEPGSASPFSLGYVPNLDGSGGGQYIEIGNGFLGSEVPRFRMLCRYGFQLIWATSFLFLIWLFYIRLFKYVVIFLKYAFEWINEAFAS